MDLQKLISNHFKNLCRLMKPWTGFLLGVAWNITYSYKLQRQNKKIKNLIALSFCLKQEKTANKKI